MAPVAKIARALPRLLANAPDKAEITCGHVELKRLLYGTNEFRFCKLFLLCFQKKKVRPTEGGLGRPHAVPDPGGREAIGSQSLFGSIRQVLGILSSWAKAGVRYAIVRAINDVMLHKYSSDSRSAIK